MREKKKKGRDASLPASARPEQSSKRDFVFQDRFLEDLHHWVRVDSRLASRVLDLVDDVKRAPFEGKGKPELLKHNLRGLWSRRIDDEHRLVYEVLPDRVLFVSARFHY